MMAQGARKIHFGVSGWDYRDWQGPLYPQPLPAGFRALPLLARFLDFMEVNVTFYRPLRGSASQRWLAETPAEFRFVIKAWKGWTHESREPAGPEMEAFQDLLRPLIEARRLHGVLAQFPPFFRDRPESRALLLRLRDAVSPASILVEVRHRSLYCERFLAFLEREQLHFVNVDLPAVRSLPRPTRINTGALAFLRLHGRNAPAWGNPRSGRDDRYDYEYPTTELSELREIVMALVERAPHVLVGANNHFLAHAPAAMVELRSMVEGQPVPAPRALILSHPRLAACAVPLEEVHAPGGP